MLLSRHPRIRRAKPLLGTIVEISVLSLNRSDIELATLVTRAFTKVQNVHSMMSFFDAESEVSLLNNTPPGTPIQVSPETQKVLAMAQDLSVQSGGAFDVMYRGRTVYPEAALHFLPSGEVYRTHAAPVDLGGIAKGFAVDQAASIFMNESDVSASINAGGDIRFVGPDYFPVSIRSPLFNGEFFDGGMLANCAIATSVFASTSISVIAPSCMVADMLTKALWRLSEPNKTELLTKYQARYIQIDESKMSSSIAMAS